ncbi:unnamed protein product [Protopolystoma xenopodis]|uniref:Secreted protein n=1 Tax=Protopolystoma xenopodis TaxID=117903 RepID=A0A3S5CRB6_9PLAT|nr:unnamed protein product [Protopolystoma xenopodis]
MSAERLRSARCLQTSLPLWSLWLVCLYTDTAICICDTNNAWGLSLWRNGKRHWHSAKPNVRDCAISDKMRVAGDPRQSETENGRSAFTSLEESVCEAQFFLPSGRCSTYTMSCVFMMSDSA